MPSLLKWYLIIGAGIMLWSYTIKKKAGEMGDPMSYLSTLSVIVLWPLALWIEFKNRNAE